MAKDKRKQIIIEGKHKNRRILVVYDKENNYVIVRTKRLGDEPREIVESEVVYTMETFFLIWDAFNMMASDDYVHEKMQEAGEILSKMGEPIANTNIESDLMEFRQRKYGK